MQQDHKNIDSIDSRSNSAGSDFMSISENNPLQTGSNYQAFIPSKSKKNTDEFQAMLSGFKLGINGGEKDVKLSDINVFKANYSLEEIDKRLKESSQFFDYERQSIREVGLLKTGKSILMPERNTKSCLVWDPTVLTPQFFTKCAYLNQFLLEKNTQVQLKMSEFQLFFEDCKMDDAKFLDQILNFDKFEKPMFRDFVLNTKGINLTVKFGIDQNHKISIEETKITKN